MHSEVAAGLGYPKERGQGAGRFRIERMVRGFIKDKARAINFYTTLFAPRGEHGRRLNRHLLSSQPVLVLARLTVRDYHEHPRWPGFWFIAKPARKRPWGLVVEEICSEAPPSVT